MPHSSRHTPQPHKNTATGIGRYLHTATHKPETLPSQPGAAPFSPRLHKKASPLPLPLRTCMRLRSGLAPSSYHHHHHHPTSTATPTHVAPPGRLSHATRATPRSFMNSTHLFSPLGHRYHATGAILEAAVKHEYSTSLSPLPFPSLPRHRNPIPPPHHDDHLHRPLLRAPRRPHPLPLRPLSGGLVLVQGASRSLLSRGASPRCHAPSACRQQAHVDRLFHRSHYRCCSFCQGPSAGQGSGRAGGD